MDTGASAELRCMVRGGAPLPAARCHGTGRLHRAQAECSSWTASRTALVLEMLAINDPEVPVWAAADLLSAGLIIGRHGPTVVVLDIAMAGIDPLRSPAVASRRRNLDDWWDLRQASTRQLARRARDAGFVLIKSSDNLQELVADLQALLSPSA